MNMKKLKKDEKGFTFIELLIAILLTGIVASAITGTILYVFNANFRTANRMAAVRQVRNVGFWISPDGQMAKNVTIGGDPGTLFTFTWQEWETGYSHEVTYSLVDTSGEFKILKREHYDSGTESITIDILAEYIDPAETSFVEDPDPDALGDSYIFEVTATVGGQSETREYKVKPRPFSQ
jgi:prepilin-type N-terminal cleavage/methylation domain-containing protein